MHWFVIKKGTEYLGTENQEPILEELVSELEPKKFGTDPALQAIFLLLLLWQHRPNLQLPILYFHAVYYSLRSIPKFE